jgi:microcystin-dependent protein
MTFIRERFLEIAADNFPALVRLSKESLTLLTSTFTCTAFRHQWQNEDGTTLTDSQWDEIQADVDRAYNELMVKPMLGTIFPYITSIPPAGALPCDGTAYAREDYPALYDALDPFWIIDADSFQVPDLRGRVIVGAGAGAGLSTYGAGDTGGEEAHTLTEAELAAHSHGVTDPTHTHSEGSTIPSVQSLSPGVPTPDVAAFVSVTGAALTGITIDSAGGDEAHENRQPYMALEYAIWAI